MFMFLNVMTLSFIGNTAFANTTISGRPCQRWDSQSPHMHPYSNLSAFENYCMNPNEDAAPWCYTTDTHRKIEFCPLLLPDGKLFYFLFYFFVKLILFRNRYRLNPKFSHFYSKMSH